MYSATYLSFVTVLMFELRIVNASFLEVVFDFVLLKNNINVFDISCLCLGEDIEKEFVKNMSSNGIFVTKMEFLNEKIIRNTDNHTILHLMDLSCTGVESKIVSLEAIGFFKSPHRWLILKDTSGSSEAAFNRLCSSYVRIDSDVVIADQDRNSGFEFHEIYKISQGRPTKVTSIGSSNSNGTSLSTHLTLYHRRKNLENEELIMTNVIVLSNATALHLDDRKDLKNDGMTKMTWLMVKECALMLNATLTARFVDTWGYIQPDGKFNGLMGELLENRSHFGSILVFSKERTDYIDYVAMIGATSLRFMFRQPPMSYVANIYTLPFSGQLWISIFIALFFAALALYAVYRHENHEYRFSDAVVALASAFCQQGETYQPRTLSSKIGTLTVFTSLMVLYAAYSANIVVLMRATSSSLRTLEDLLHSPMTLGATDIAYNRYFFSRLKDPLRKDIYKKKIAPKGKPANFYKRAEGIEKLRQGSFALHMETSTAYRMIQDTFQEHEKCNIVEMDYINEIDPWLPAQKHLPYKDMTRVSFIRLREIGIQHVIFKRIMTEKPKCSSSQTVFNSVGLTDFYPAAMLMAIGIAISAIVFIAEVFVHSVNTRMSHIYPYTD